MDVLEALQPMGEITPTTALATIQTRMDDLIARVNQLIDRSNSLDASEIAAIKQMAMDTSKELGHLKPKVDTYARTIESISEAGGDLLASMPLGHLEPPPGMTTAQFNLTVHNPDELSYAGQYRAAALAYGVSVSGQQFGRAFGMSDVWRSRVSEYQALNDALLLVDSIVTTAKGKMWAEQFGSRRERIHKAYPRLWPEYNRAAEVMRKAVDSMNTGTSNEGAEWIPTVFSAQLIDLVRNQAQVSNLFPHITMPSATYKLPAMLADSVAYAASERTTVPTDYSTKYTASLFQTRNVTLDAVLMAARIMSSKEADEDSIIPMIPQLLRSIALSIVRGQEIWYLSGDTAGTQDSDFGGASDVRVLGDGLRLLALATTAKKDFSNGAMVYRDWNLIAKKQGVYGRPGANAIIVSNAGHLELGMMRDDGGNNIMLTQKDYGPAAVLFAGEVGQIGGCPVILSDFIRDDLNASGVYDGITTDRTVAIRVNRDAHIIGDRRDVTVESSADLYMETGQIVSVATYRGDFKPLYVQPTQVTQGIGYNITTN